MLGDRFGRRPSSLGSQALMTACFALSAACPTFEWYLVAKFFLGTSLGSAATCGFTLATELVGPSLRTRATTELCGYAWAFLCCALALLCYTVRGLSWRAQVGVAAVPNFLQLFSWWYLLPESPFWLSRRGEHGKAEAVVGRLLGPSKLQLMESGSGGQSDAPAPAPSPAPGSRARSVRLQDLVRPCSVLRVTLVQIYLWATISLSYYAISFSACTRIEHSRAEHHRRAVVAGRILAPSLGLPWHADSRLSPCRRSVCRCG